MIFEVKDNQEGATKERPANQMGLQAYKRHSHEQLENRGRRALERGHLESAGINSETH
jgi:hypothetical protein